MKITSRTALAACMLLSISCSKESLRNPQAANTQTLDNSTGQTTANHYIGEYFRGGIIFYIDITGKHGLIADTADLPIATWLNNGYIKTGAKGTSIGTGKLNTSKIISRQGATNNYAALECENLTKNGYSDWFLPSRDELDSMYSHKNEIGGFTDYLYWSSSEYDLTSAWYVNFSNHIVVANSKVAGGSVRAVRSF